MWENAIQAIKNDDDRWIDEHHLAFKNFFSESNEKSTGKLNANALEAHYKHQIFKIYLSQEYNGLAYDLVEGSRFIEKASALDGNWGWLLGIGVGGAYFADYLNPQVAQEFFGTREALVCGSGMASGTAKSSSDQWRINGVWKFCSGCEQASIMTCVVKRDDQKIAILLTPSDYEIQEDWNGIGMKLTCSHTLNVEDKLVSSDRFFDLQKPPRKAEYSISSYPFMPFAKACFTPVLGGIAKAIMQTAEEILQEKKNNNKVQYNKQHQFVESFLEKFKKENHNLRSNFYQALSNSWESYQKAETVDTKEFEKSAIEWSHFCYFSCAEIIPHLGMQALEADSFIQYMWCNLQTAFQHSSQRIY